MHVRQWTEEDVADWRTIRLEALRLHPEAFGSSYEDERDGPDEAFGQGLRTNHVFAGFVGPELAGCAVFAPMRAAKMAHRGALFSMYVREAFRGTGIADLLLEAVLERAREQVLQIHCTVATANARARRLYERHGFAIYGTEPRALRVGDIFHDEHLMVLRLDRPRMTAARQG